jgi:GntR family transcriptional regulator/MocR family aminotransferase
MTSSWATSGVDLHVELRGVRRRAGLEEALREAVRTGRLAADSRLPSSRTLAVELGLARNTVAEAYGQLVAEGWLVARQGSGTRVAGRSPEAATDLDPRRPGVAELPRHDLSPGRPDLAAFPRRAWLAAGRRALQAAPDAALGYPDPRGDPGLREELSRYLGRVRGVRAPAERIVVCSGFQQALSLLATALVRAGATTLAVEALGLWTHRSIARAAGLTTVPVGVDADGARTEELPASAGAVLLTPAHQFPTGVVLTPARRAAACAWARGVGGLVIEDDYDGEFRYDRRPVGALQALAPDVVAYVGTASKSLAPGLGLAWLVVPPAWLDAVVRAKRHDDGYTGVFEQLVLAEFLRAGDHDRHVRRSRLRYRRRRDALVEVLGAAVPGVQVTGIAAGLHAVLGLDGARAADEEALLARAARAGLALAPLAPFRHDPDRAAPGGLVVGYGTPPDHGYAAAVDALVEVLRGADDAREGAADPDGAADREDLDTRGRTVTRLPQPGPGR